MTDLIVRVRNILQFMDEKIIFVCLLLCILLSCSKEHREEKVQFKYDGDSGLIIENLREDSIYIQISNWRSIPLEEQKIDTFIDPGEEINIRLEVQNKNYYDFTIDGTKHRFYSSPHDNDTLIFDGTLKILGDNDRINKFLEKRRIELNGVDAEWMPRVNATYSATTSYQLFHINDSITKNYIDHLNHYRNFVPTNFFQFEESRLQYLNNSYKINSLSYRKKFLDFVDSIPPGFADTIASKVDITNTSMLGNIDYHYFLNDYIHFLDNPSLDKVKPSSNREWQKSYDLMFDKIKRSLSGEVLDYYLLARTVSVQQASPAVFMQKWLNHIHSDSIREQAKELTIDTQDHDLLKQVPYFYVKEIQGSSIEPSDLIGKVTLINFWATWCKPCLEEFPKKNKIQSHFENTINVLNICIDSREERCKEVIENHKLLGINAVAIGEWSEKLEERFNIRGLPHSVLIDPDGVLSNNKLSGDYNDLVRQIESYINYTDKD